MTAGCNDAVAFDNERYLAEQSEAILDKITGESISTWTS